MDGDTSARALNEYDSNRVIDALLEYLDARLETRWGGPGVGVEWRVVAKGSADGTAAR